MKENRGKNKLRRWGRVLIVFAILALVICIVKAKVGGTVFRQRGRFQRQRYHGLVL